MEKKRLAQVEASARYRARYPERHRENVKKSAQKKKERIEKTIAYLKGLLDAHGIPYDTVI